MKHPFVKLSSCFGFVLAVALAAGAQTQNRERFGISARAGGINSVIGRVVVKRAGQTSEQPLTTQDELASGDVVNSSVGSRVEILLSPGSYLRIGQNSEFNLVDNTTDNVSVKLVRGSAIIEATGTDETKLKINISTDQTSLVIVRRGIYRLNVEPDLTELLVKKGRVLIANGSGETVKGGDKRAFTGSAVIIAKGTSRDDEFDNWSKERGKILAQANAGLSTRVLSSYLTSPDWKRPSGSLGVWGLWVVSPALRCYTFMPFANRHWFSPYGETYGYYYDVGFYYGVFDLSGCCNNGIRQPSIVRNPPLSTAAGALSGGPGASGSSGVSSGSVGSATSGSSAGLPSNRNSAPSPPREPDAGQHSINRPRVP